MAEPQQIVAMDKISSSVHDLTTSLAVLKIMVACAS